MKKGFLKKQRNIAIAILAVFIMTMFGIVALASGEGSAAKSGTYCTVAGACTKLKNSPTKMLGYAYITNKTGGKAYMTINLKSYNSNNVLQDTYSYSGQKSSGSKLSTSYVTVSSSYTVKSTGSIYKGTSSSSGQLETLTITIN